MSILTKTAGEVTARCSKRKYFRVRKKMIERFFLNGVNSQSAGVAVGHCNQLLARSLPDVASAAFAILHAAMSWTKVAFDPPVIVHMPISRRFHKGIISLFFHKGIS